jgi:WD40 repeat protein
MVAKLADGMFAAHQHNIIHRDLKPANVLLTSNDEPKITDFGLAKRLDAGAGPTTTGNVLGTPTYMAPEQANGLANQIGPCSDIWALGVILYELLIGRPPFRGETPMETMLQIVQQEPVPPRRLLPKVPRDLETICMKCLQKDPARRFKTAQELGQELEKFLKGMPIQAKADNTLRRFFRWVRKHPGLIAVAFLAFLVSGAGSGAMMTDNPLRLLVPLLTAVTVIGFGGTLYQYRQAQAERHRAGEQRQQAEAARNEAEQQAQRAAEALRTAEASMYFLQIALAERERQSANVVRAEELLEACPANVRRWEWRYLRRLCHAELMSLEGHTRPVLAVTFSPDGKSLASAGWDHEVCIWNADAGQLVKTLLGHEAQVTALAFSPDGHLLASAGGDQMVIVWATDTGKKVQSWKCDDGVLALAFAPDGQRLASAGADGAIQIWAAKTGRPQRELTGKAREIMALAFSPDGEWLASAGGDRTIRLWDGLSGESLRTLTGHEGPVHGLAFSPDGKRLASGGDDQMVRVWDCNSGKEVGVGRGHIGPVLGVAFHPHGHRIASVSADRTVRYWDAATCHETATLHGHTGIVSSLSFRPDGRVLATASKDQTVKLWNAMRGPEGEILVGHSGPVCGMAFSPDSRHLLSCAGPTGPGEVTYWDLASHEMGPTIREPSIGVNRVAHSPDGRMAAAAWQDGRVIVWDGPLSKEKYVLKAHAGGAGTLSFSADNRHLATGGEDGLVKVWQMLNGHEQKILRPGMPIADLAWRPEHRQLVVGCNDRLQNKSEVRIYEVMSGKELHAIKELQGQVSAVACSPDGDVIAAALGAEVLLWDGETMRPRTPLRGHTDDVLGLTFSPDGQRLATVSLDQTVKLWASATGQELLQLRGHTDAVIEVQFSPNGRLLATASSDRTIRLWEAGA